MKKDMRIKQCGSCENVFRKGRECPKCGSGNWVYGYIDIEPKKKKSSLKKTLEKFTTHEDKWKNIWIIPKRKKLKKVI